MSATLATTYEDFLADLADLRQVRPNTLRAYRYELTAASRDGRFHGPLDALTITLLEGWVAHSPARPSTMSRCIAAFTRFFAWALRHAHCSRNLLLQRTPIPQPRRLPRPIRTLRERSAIDVAITRAPAPYRLVFTILRETGMRVSEVLQLRLADILLDPSRESIRVHESKTGTERSVILGPTATPRTLRGLRSYLKTLQGYGPQEILFRSNRGTPLSYDAVHYQWTKVCQRAALVDSAGKPVYTLHQLRHTRGSELIEQGQRIELVQRVLGHRDIRSTLGYADLNDQHVRAALEDRRR